MTIVHCEGEEGSVLGCSEKRQPLQPTEYCEEQSRGQLKRTERRPDKTGAHQVLLLFGLSEGSSSISSGSGSVLSLREFETGTEAPRLLESLGEQLVSLEGGTCDRARRGRSGRTRKGKIRAPLLVRPARQFALQRSAPALQRLESERTVHFDLPRRALSTKVRSVLGQ